MGHTMAEAILAKASGSNQVEPGDHVVCDVDLTMTQDIHTPGIAHLLEEMGVAELRDPSSVVVVMDHVAPSHTVEDASSKMVMREFVEKYGVEHFYEVGTGISHEVLPEKGHVKPGQLVVGSDSHTVTHGAFGAAGTGLGDTDIAYALATGQNWFRVPETVEFVVEGEFDDRASAKDLLLHIAGEYGTDIARYRSIEFKGPAIESLPLDDRITLTNMSIELGAKFGFTPVDDDVVNYVEARTDDPIKPAQPDPDAEYAERHRIDVTDLEPQVALPHNVQNVEPISAVEPVEIDQVFIGSCTNGKFEDLRAAAAVLESESVAPMTRLIVTPASRDILRRAEQEGLTDVFHEAGAVVTHATCGACPGMGVGVLGPGERCMAAQNRNFRGRMGHNDSEIYLGSPETAAATAIAGKIADPRRRSR
jgi:3-isopropylmalate/(R)-2-methylmalate dehydratase large subunit